jgi:hypothetical protein
VIWVARGLIATLAVVLLATNLRDWPAPWFDEGMHVAAAAVLARDGVYGLPEGASFSRFDPHVQVGPAVIAPVALGLRITGVDRISTRTTMVILSLAALIAVWILASQVFDERTALLTVLLLLAGSPEFFCSFVFMARQVLGEVPALGYYAVGLALILRQVRLDKTSLLSGLAAGLLWGAAMLSKPHLVALVPGGMVLVAVADRWYYGRRVWRVLALPIGLSVASFMVWHTVRWIALDTPGMLSATQTSPGWLTAQIVTTEWVDRRRALGILVSSGFVVLGLPGLLWGGWQVRSRDDQGLRASLGLAVPLSCLFWFSCASIGWARYAFFPVTMSAMWSAGLLWRLWDMSAERRASHLVRPLLVAGVVVLLAWNVAPTIQAIRKPPDTGFAQMRLYLLTRVDPTATVETWEWEFSIDEHPRYTHPDIDTFVTATRVVMSGQRVAPTLYDGRRRNPAFVLVGPFGAWTGIYDHVVRDEAELVVRHGRYSLYRLAGRSAGPSSIVTSRQVQHADQ